MNRADSGSFGSTSKLIGSKNKKNSRRAIAPVIATILLVAIAVVGAGLVFATSGDYQNHLQISNSNKVTFIEFPGYDARDVSVLRLHDGTKVNNSANPGDFDGQTDNGLVTGERVAIYVKNKSTSTVYFDKVRFGGTEYDFVPGGTLTAYSTAFLNPGEFAVATKGTSGVADLLSSGFAELQSGKEATFLIELSSDLKMPRDTQITVTTTNGATFVGTVLLGQHKE